MCCYSGFSALTPPVYSTLGDGERGSWVTRQFVSSPTFWLIGPVSPPTCGSLPEILDETICMLLAFCCIKHLLFIPDMLPLAPWGRL
jgi:hypothetical protein